MFRHQIFSGSSFNDAFVVKSLELNPLYIDEHLAKVFDVNTVFLF